jgi:hypothetical protein
MIVCTKEKFDRMRADMAGPAPQSFFGVWAEDGAIIFGLPRSEASRIQKSHEENGRTAKIIILDADGNLVTE